MPQTRRQQKTFHSLENMTGYNGGTKLKKIGRQGWGERGEGGSPGCKDIIEEKKPTKSLKPKLQKLDAVGIEPTTFHRLTVENGLRNENHTPRPSAQS